MFRLAKKQVIFFVLALLAGLPIAAEASMAQFISRLYTEALGRGVDQSGWVNGALGHPQSGASCQAVDFYSLANGIYTSPEYQNIGYTNAEKVLTLYRGILNREPDSLASLQFSVNILNSGYPISTVISNFVNSAEFSDLKNNKICSTSGNLSDSIYRWGNNQAIAIGSVISPADLQASLNNAANSNNKTVSLPSGSIVFVDRKITIPAGVTLSTSGVTNRQQYARMARLVRVAHFGGTSIRGDSALVSMESGAKINAIWISGQRDAIVNGSVLPYQSLSINVFVRGGSGGAVQNSRLDTVAGNTNMAIDGYEEGSPCSGLTIDNNLVTGYSNTHYPVNNIGQFSDGITVACENATVTNNNVVDASDVAIILFRSGPVPQASRVQNNMIISSGVSAYAAMAYEPYFENPPQAKLFSFAGSIYSNNVFWGSPDSHFDIGISVGTKAWNPTNDTGYTTSILNNSNQGIGTIMQIGIGVDGLTNATISGNTLAYVQQVNNGFCATRGAFVVNPDSSRATPGTIAPGTSYVYGSLDSCHMSHANTTTQ